MVSPEKQFGVKSSLHDSVSSRFDSKRFECEIETCIRSAGYIWSNEEVRKKAMLSSIRELLDSIFSRLMVIHLRGVPVRLHIPYQAILS